MNLKVKQVVSYKGHSLSQNGSVNFNLKASYSELTHTIEAMQMLNNDVKIKSKAPGSKPMNLGMFRIKQIVIDGDGESTLKFNSLSDYVELDNLNSLPLAMDDNKEFQIVMQADIELEEEDAEE